MKKFIYFCLLLAVIVTFSGCSGDDTIYEDEELSGDDGSYAECPELRGIWEFVSANLKYSHTSTLSNPVVEGTLVFTNDLKVIRNLKYSDGSKVKDTYKCMIKNVTRYDENVVGLSMKTTPCMIGFHDYNGYASLFISNGLLCYTEGGDEPILWIFKKKE